MGESKMSSTTELKYLCNMLDPHSIQDISWAQSSGSDILSEGVNAFNVTVESCGVDQSAALGCPAMTLKNITDYPFTLPTNDNRCRGVAIHKSQQYIAYAINRNEKERKGFLRVLNQNNNKRDLIRGVKDFIVDFEFAWLNESVLIAITDTNGDFYLYKVTEEDDEEKLIFNELLHVINDEHNSNDSTVKNHSVTWCPYVPDNNAKNDINELMGPHLLAVTHENVVEMWQVYKLIDNGNSIVMPSSALAECPYMIGKCELDCSVTATSISPDGTCIAIASSGGSVKFFQVESSDENENGDEESESKVLECVHEWKPYIKSPVSTLFFLDNYAGDEDGQGRTFWNYAVTGTNNNTQLKVWACKTWSCVQTIGFNLPSNKLNDSPIASSISSQRSSSASPCIEPPNSFAGHLKNGNEAPRLDTYIDLSSSCILCVDRINGICFILMLSNLKTNQTVRGSADEDDPSNDFTPIVISVSRVPIQFTPLSLAITSLDIKYYQKLDQSENNESHCESDNDSKKSNASLGVMMKCHIMSSKSLMQAIIKCESKVPYVPNTKSSSLQDCQSQRMLLDMPPSFKDAMDGLTDLSASMSISQDGESAEPLNSYSPAFDIKKSENLDVVKKNELSKLLPPDHFTSKLSSASAMSVSDLNTATVKLSLIEEPASEKMEESKLTKDKELEQYLYETEAVSTDQNSANGDFLASLLGISQNTTNKSEPVAAEGDMQASEGPKSQSIDGIKGRLAQVCSSTSSPSLEIQEILERDVEETDSGSTSESSGSRGPTQISLLEQPGQEESKHNQDILDAAVLLSASIRAVQTPVENMEEDTSLLQNLLKFSEEDTTSMQATLQKAADNALGDMLKRSDSSKVVPYTCEQLEAKIRDSDSGWCAQQLASKDNVQVKQAVKPKHINGTEETQAAHHSNVAQMKELQEAMHQTQKQLQLITEKLDSMNKQQNSASSPQQLAETVRQAVEVAVREEMKRAAAKSISEIAGSAVVTELQTQLGTLMAQMEQKILTSVSMLISSKQFSDNLGGVISNAVIPGVKDSCSDSYAHIILPGFQGLTKSILQQLNDLYQKGTADYLLQVRKEVNDFMVCLENTKTCTIGEMEASKSSLGVLMKSHQEIISQHQAAMHQHSSSLVTEETIKRIVSDEMTKVVTLLQRLPTGTQTPNSAVNYLAQHDKQNNPKQAQLQLEQLIAAKQFNTAFKHALSANDLSQVLFVCERVNRESLMVAGNSKLSQDVLMSLINQLSHDLEQKTDLKMKFLEDSLLCLDISNPVTQEHIQTVAQSLQRNLQAYLETNPPQQLQNRFRMLLLAASHHASSRSS